MGNNNNHQNNDFDVEIPNFDGDEFKVPDDFNDVNNYNDEESYNNEEYDYKDVPDSNGDPYNTENYDNVQSYDDVNVEDFSLDLSDDDVTDSGEVTQGDYKNNKFNLNLGGNGPLKWIIIGVVAVILIITLIIFGAKSLFGNSGNKNNANQAQTEQSINNNNENGKKLFKASIKNAVDAQSAKYQLSVDWKNATLDYGQSGNKESFQQKLQAINDERIKLINSIEQNGNELNNLVIDSLNAMKTSLDEAYNSSNPDQAIDIYNKWQGNADIFDKEYVDKLTDLLKKNKLEYKVDEKDGQVTIEY